MKFGEKLVVGPADLFKNGEKRLKAKRHRKELWHALDAEKAPHSSSEYDEAEEVRRKLGAIVSEEFEEKKQPSDVDGK